MIFTHEITLDITFNEIKIINLKQYTKDSFLLHVNLTDRGEPFCADKNNLICQFKMKTPDDKCIFTDGIINDDGSVDISIPEKACLTAGSGTAEIIFVTSEIVAKANSASAGTNKPLDSSDTESVGDSVTGYGTHPQDGAVFATMNLSVNIVASSYHNDYITSSDDFDALHSALLAANKTYDRVMTSANASADAAAQHEGNARTAENNAKTSESNAADFASAAGTSANAASGSALMAQSYAVGGSGLSERKNENNDCAKHYCEEANKEAHKSSDSALLAKSYAVGGTGIERPDNNKTEAEDNAEYYCKQAEFYYLQAQDAKNSLDGALRPMGTVSFEELLTLTGVQTGDMYNISNQFTTNDQFREGPGLTIPLGANVYKTGNGEWDVLAGSPVTGVKGHSETSYRKGNVNITPANIGLGNVDNTADSSKNVATAKRLTVEADNFKQGTDLPSTYPRGATVFFSNNPANKFNGIAYCTIHTIKGYNNMACIQFLYPYSNRADKFYFREALYNADAWRDWQEVITSANIGSQSVSYATSAGSANKATQDGDGNVIKDSYAVRKIITGGDFHDMVTPGLYGMKRCSNTPNDEEYCALLVLTSDTGGYVEQIAFVEGSEDIYICNLYNGNTWSEWKQLYVEGNITTGIKKDIVDIIYPIGSIYMSVNSTSPATLFGGTWVRWGNGRVAVGVDTSQTEFSTVEKTGGAKTHTLTTSEIPSHSHTVPSQTINSNRDGEHQHQIKFERNATSTGTRTRIASGGTESSASFTENSGAHSHTVTVPQQSTQNTGSGNAHNNLQPYITCYMWKRTA